MNDRATVDQLDRELTAHAAAAEQALASEQARGAALELALADAEARLASTEQDLAAVRLHLSVIEALPFDLIRFLQREWIRKVGRVVRLVLPGRRRAG
jgi:chromosome segregation ATPase